jgi:hypothetical protein
MRPRKTPAYAQLNARIMPVARGKRFETPLTEALAKNGFGEVGGGGTLRSKTGEIVYCGIDVNLSNRANRASSMIGACCVRGLGEQAERWTTCRLTKMSMPRRSGLRAIHDLEKTPIVVTAAVWSERCSPRLSPRKTTSAPAPPANCPMPCARSWTPKGKLAKKNVVIIPRSTVSYVKGVRSPGLPNKTLRLPNITFASE